MKIYNNWKEFTITFDYKEYTIPKWESECNQDLLSHIKWLSDQLQLNVTTEPIKIKKEEIEVEEDAPSDEEISEKLKEKRKWKK